MAFAIPVALLTAIDLWYNQVRFGSMFDTGYAREASKQGFNRPLLSGLDLFLRSPGRGIFWSAPILLAALPGFVFLVRRCRAIGLVLAGLCVLRLLFYARWWAADGGVGWGPRLLFPITALLVIAAGELIEHLWVYASPRRRHAAWVTLGALAAASGFLALLSVFVPYEQWWRESVNRNRAASIPQQTHDYYFSASRNPIVGDLRLMARTRPFPLQHFVGGPSTVGIAAVLIALVSGIAAIVVASRRDSDASRRSIAKGT